MSALSKATNAQLQHELLTRAIARAEARIEATERQLFQMREKQAARRIELAGHGAQSKINNPKSKIQRGAA